MTGAGISAESGVPTFRGSGGFWEGRRAEDIASPAGFLRDPEMVWRWYRSRRAHLATVEPNAGHHALVRLERGVERFCLATQNVDRLHRRAGSRNVLEIHGDILASRCFRNCGAEPVEDPRAAVPRCSCGEMLRPAVVWFGEMLPVDLLEKAMAAAISSDVCLVVGTSGLVYPAAGFSAMARQAGAFVIDVNPEDTPHSAKADISLRGTAATVLPLLLEEIGIPEEPGRRAGV
ncbi:MAG: NAD-dependent deacylase [Candidatus Eisenbacteria bacterium]|nr:NAD-dependent deacylase [Candidatus Eisenbacteria bacterium]